MRLVELANKRVAVWGYGREGQATLSTLRKYFPDRPLSLICSSAEAEGARALDDAKLSIIPGDANVATLAQFDVVIKSPGISPYKSPAPEARAAGVRFTSGSALWFAEHPSAHTICVTGTKGKSTVTALIAHLLRKNGLCVALAGNIGLPLLELLDPPREPDWWVIELSSFQTCDFDGAPTVAVINNLFEEHLDWHGTREKYAADKLTIAARARHLVVNAQPGLLAATAGHPTRSMFDATAGWHVRADAIWRGADRNLPLAKLPFPGLHNARNVCAALSAIEAAGLDACAMAVDVASFLALPHRLQSLGEHDGLEYINDSISTTPYASIEALRSLSGQPVTVLVGGFDRGVDWSIFVDYVSKYPPHAIVTMGANGPSIAKAVRRTAVQGFILKCADSLNDAIARARELTPINGIVLLSPGAPSFDQFRDYAERGREFARLTGADPAAIAQIQGLGVA